MQITVPTLSKDILHGFYGVLKATTLLSRMFDHSGIRGPLE